MTGCGKYRLKLESHKELYIRQERNLIIKNDFANIKIEQYDGAMAKLTIVKEVVGSKKEKQKEVFKDINMDIKKDDEGVTIYTSGFESIDSSIISTDVTCLVQLPKKIN